MPPAPREFIIRAEDLQGFTEPQIRTHTDVTYVALVNRLTEARQRLESADRAKANAYFSEFHYAKSAEVDLINAVQLHENYFMALSGKRDEGGAQERVQDRLSRDFGSFDAWRDDFRAVGRAARGWAVLAMNLDDGRLHNYLAEANSAAVWNCVVILALDMHEHAFSQDYPGRRAAYLETFLRNLRWDQVEQRLVRADQVLAVYTER